MPVKCEWCNDRGMLPVYHLEYRGDSTLYVEREDLAGEIRTYRTPGVIAVHCTCPLGAWARNNVKQEERDRIPTLGDVIGGRIPYQVERPDLEDETGLTDAARAFIRRWKDGFGGHPLPRAHKCELEDVANALRARNTRLAEEATEPVTGGAA